MKYAKESPRLSVKFINAETEQILFEIKDRSWMNIGEIFSDSMATEVIQNELKNKKFKLPQKLLILAVGEFDLQ
jgi:hypothetical protein